MFRRSLTLLGAAVVALLFLSACTSSNPDKDPWDNTHYFKQDRQRSPQVVSELEHRLVYKQSDR
jgi:hypothetical protein